MGCWSFCSTSLATPTLPCVEAVGSQLAATQSGPWVRPSAGRFLPFHHHSCGRPLSPPQGGPGSQIVSPFLTWNVEENQVPCMHPQLPLTRAPVNYSGRETAYAVVMSLSLHLFPLLSMNFAGIKPPNQDFSHLPEPGTHLGEGVGRLGNCSP